MINYRNKAARAEAVAAGVRDLGRRALTAQADLTDAGARRQMLAATVAAFGGLDVLILNASGGPESDRPDDYPLRLNRDAQLEVAEAAAAAMPAGGRIVFVTSHEAHFYSPGSTLPAYARVAASKQAGERALRARERSFTDRGIGLVVVSGDLIDGTITARLLDRVRPGLIEQRRSRAGGLPTVDDFARAVAGAALDPEPDPIVFVGTVDTERLG